MSKPQSPNMDLAADPAVIHIAMKLAAKAARRAPHLLDELESEALVQLAEAARTFDPTKGASFKTYAYRVISSRMNNCLKLWMPKGFRQKYQREDGTPIPAVGSLQKPTCEDDGGGSLTIGNMIAEDRPSPGEAVEIREEIGRWKQCRNCKEWYPRASGFHSQRTREHKDWLYSWCKYCVRLSKNRRDANPDVKRRRAEYRARSDVKERQRIRDMEPGRKLKRYRCQKIYLKSPRGKLRHNRSCAAYRLRKATTDEQRSRLKFLIEMYDREILRFDSERQRSA